MGPETMTATNDLVDYGMTIDELTEAVDNIATATAWPIRELRLHSISGDHTIPLEDAITTETVRTYEPAHTSTAWDRYRWAGGWSGTVNIDAADFLKAYVPYKEDDDEPEDFDVPDGADTALLECFGVE